MAEQTRFDLSQDQMPTAWFNIMPSIVQAGMQPLPPLHPGTHEPIGPGRPGAAVPRVADHAGGLDRPVDRHPRPGPRHLPAVEADAAVPRHAAGAGAADARPHLLQVRGRLAGRVAQAEHRRRRRPTTTRRRGSGGSPPRPAPGSGARRWRWRAASSASSATVYMVQGLVRAEAVPAHLHGDVRRRRCTRRRPTRRRPGSAILAEHPDSTGSLGIAISEAVEVAATQRRTRTTRSAACWTTCCCTRR